MQDPRHERGSVSEDLAVERLRGEGYRILDRNARFKCGELDVVAKEGGVLAFVEVRSREAGGLRTPEETVTLPKQVRIARAAGRWIVRKRLRLPLVRYDVVAVEWTGDRPEIRLVRNAFRVSAWTLRKIR